MKRLALAIGGLVLLVIMMSASAATATGSSQNAQFPGSVCRAVSGTVAYTQYGVHNTAIGGMAGAPGTAQVICPLPLTAPAAGGSTVGSITVNYYDRGASGFRVSCGFQAVDSQGNIAFSGASTSPSGGPGTGLQTFTWGPFGPAPFDPASYRLSVNCSIPPVNSGWTSHITGMQASVVLP